MIGDLRVISWTPTGTVRYLDQTLLPHEETYREARTVDEMVEAIKVLRIRGAPLIGIGAAMGLAAAARQAPGALTYAWIEAAAATLGAARPTAVNLMWALDRMRRAAHVAFDAGAGRTEVVQALHDEAQRIWDEDAAMCRAIGQHGAALVPHGATVLTHCNAGALATGGIGTALGVVYAAHEQGREVSVVSCETRPLRQGARLTAWELARVGVPVTSIVDGAAGTVLSQGRVDLVITGADRIAANGDVANKIGTYNLAVLARAHDVPFYVAAPASTFDMQVAAGAGIPIEERSGDEVNAAPGALVYNPAFDITPADHITAIVSDRGVLEPPYGQSLPRAFD